MSKLFISHSSQDDGFVRELRAALADHGQAGWVDSRELRGGDPLWPEINKALDDASAYAVVVSPDALQSKWVGKELAYALKLRKKRGKENFPVIPLSLNGTKLGVLEEFFGDEPIYIPVTSDAGGIEAAMNAILVALGKRLNADVPGTPQPRAEPLEELVLELTDLKFKEDDGKRRATAKARLVYQPATVGQREVASAQRWTFVAPIGPIEAGELKWYLEQYATWPSDYFRPRAKKVEDNLVEWGQLLHNAALPSAHREEVMKAWEKVSDNASRRFSVQVDVALVADAPKSEVDEANEAATILLGLPWELLHNGKNYLFKGAKPTRVRRTLPSTESMGVPVVSAPIRVLLITARPEDESCSYIDHRASALPLVDAMEALPGLVKIHVLSPPTLGALSEELDRARSARTPYHVVHFDGHGVYDKQVGLGGLCFELPEDAGKLDRRRHVTVNTDELGPLLRDHRIPLVFLEACQTAMAEQASESVASELLRVGVASVVAMSHSVLVETARRFVGTFYKALAAGKRVGDAMLAGQRALKDDTFRGRIFGAGALKLEDWFVPVLFQEKEDPQLFKSTPAKQTVEDFKTGLAVRLGQLPPVAKTGFIGRSRELLALQRLLRHERYAVVRGQGGEGKTALAAEFARWMVRSHQIHRAAFVSVETNGNALAVLDAIGSQLIPNYSAAAFESLEKAIIPLERALGEQATLLVVDNMESVLLPPFMREETPEALSEEAAKELNAILDLCTRLIQSGGTRLVFTSREYLPAPFDAPRHQRELRQLHRPDAVKLVERALNEDSDGPGSAPTDATSEAIEALVDAVHCHARTLTLLAPELRSRGVEATRTALMDLMAQMEKQFPGSREKSLFASVELSLRRLSPANRDRVHVLGVFHGGVQLGMLSKMMQWETDDVAALAVELIETGLATPNRYNHLTLNPALCPYLRGRLESTEREALTARWVEAMSSYVDFLYQQSSQNAEIAATLSGLELHNIFALLDLVQRKGDPEATISLATSLYRLLQSIGKPLLLERLGKVRDAAAVSLGNEWSHAQFQAIATRIEQNLAVGKFYEAKNGIQNLFQRTQIEGVQAYPNADYDQAYIYWLLARIMKVSGSSEQSLPLMEEAFQRFEALGSQTNNTAAESMATSCLIEKGDCLFYLGRFEAASAAYEESIRRSIKLSDDRSFAIGKGQLGIVRMEQHLYSDALVAHEEARERFSLLKEPGQVGVSWHLTGMVYQQSGQPEAAEISYRKSLAIQVQLRNSAEQANTLAQLASLYDHALNRPEEALIIYRQAADMLHELRNVAKEGIVRSNLGATLRKLGRLEEAREETLRAIECGSQFGQASSPWVTWATLAAIERDAGNLSAAAEAKFKAATHYLNYRRAGGENLHGPGRIALAVSNFMLSGVPTKAAALVEKFSADPTADRILPFLVALRSIVYGSRDKSLASATDFTYAVAADEIDLSYTMPAEIIILIETLEKHSL